ncbi:MAG: bifunctional rhamnulose-1-phosphate aldolase/short-chain dehydrogenase [Actinomycetota bacterium]
MLQELLDRSHRLGADKRITNFAGGNTSAKLVVEDPVTGREVRVLAVKGSGGDLGSLTADGVALLDLDRVLALEAHWDAGATEADMVALYDQCRFGPPGAPPSIDTPLHALLPVHHIDHVHPDAVIALATARDGRALTEACFGDEAGWLDWLRPGFELGLALRAQYRANPALRGVVLGGHGLICWGETASECEATTHALIERATAFLEAEGRPEPFGAPIGGWSSLSTDRDAAAALAPAVRGIASTDRPVVGHFTDAPVVMELVNSEAAPRLAALGTSCPDHFLRTKVAPLLVDLPPSASLDARVARLRERHDEYRETYRRYYETHATDASPPMRGSDPVVVLVTGVGMWSFGTDPVSARIAGEFYVNAINVMRGAETVSAYVPISDAEKFGVEYWDLEERKLRARPPLPPLAGRVALVTGGASGIGRAVATALAGVGAAVVVADRDGDGAAKVVGEIGDERALAVTVDVTDENAVDAAFAAAALRFGGVDLVVNNAGLAAAAPLVDTTTEVWDRLHDVMARGSFLVSRAAARTMTAAGTGGDIVYIVSKNAVAAGTGNVAYSAAKADQAHQVRLLAAELGTHGIRVNGVNPDGVVQGSGIFDSEWRTQRAAAYGVEPDRLGEFYASRTLLGREVLPEHVADAVVALVDGRLSRTTGLILPVDGGVAGAFLR